ncbi:centrosome-associated protein 350 [Dendroctonus ponderosae]|uniref:centrosome-associated protein 350 n=1 Tax=Dendroctonus ponderosae TaxID=77166 RepID=UPI002035C7A4|nr:centrosome-associated protein 350 [Dendroctonus ponderosae]
MDKSLDKSSVSQKIFETTRDTERLKQELQSLIAAGLRGRTSPPLATSYQNEPLESTNKVQILKSFDPKHSQHVKKAVEKPSPRFKPSSALPNSSPKKQRTYNVDEAREYLHNQRKKRAEELRSQKAGSKVSIDLKKEKLKQLQEKANELVRKNVQAKRSRSKSREPAIARSRSATVQQPSAKSKKPLEESVILGFNCGASSVSVRPATHLGFPKSNSIRNAISLSNINSETRHLGTVQSPHLQTPAEVNYGTSTTFNHNLTSNFQSQASKSAGRPLETVQSLSGNSEIPLSSKRKNQEKMVLNPTEKIPKLREPEKVTSPWLKVPDSAFSKLISSYANSTGGSFPSNKVLTEEKTADEIHPQQREPAMSKVTPHWLKEQPDGDPYNLINTIKRRCQLDYGVTTANKPSVVDVGVQSNIDAAQNTNSTSSKSELNSFKSHQHLNLARKTTSHLELPAFKDGPTLTKPSHYSSENESDTSRNIPSISSESALSLPRNINIRQSYAICHLKPLEEAPPNLDPEKIEDIKLKVSKEVSSSYSDVFDSSRGSRSSIISFNKSKRSPNSMNIRPSNSKERKPRKIFQPTPEDPVEKPLLSTSSEAVATDEETQRNRWVQQGAMPKSSSSTRSKSSSVKISSKNHSGEDVESKSIPEAICTVTSTDCYRPSAISESKDPLEPNSSMVGLKSDPHIPNSEPASEKPNSRLLMQNITLRSSKAGNRGSDDNVLHLKFEAEIHLLTDFNQTIQRFSEIERTFESLRGDNCSLVEKTARKPNVPFDIPAIIVTSTVPSDTTEVETSLDRPKEMSQSQVSKVSSTTADQTEASYFNTALIDQESCLDGSIEKSETSLFQPSVLDSNESLNGTWIGDENFVFKNVVGMSVKVFDQLIKDEDARIENWRKMLKIREQFLLERTRGELQFLEMQRKQLIETGKLAEASLIKKKQRGILLKHQEERHEMQRLKQMQKEESQKRKTVLRNERNSFKKELLSTKMLAKLKLSGRDRKERTFSGPFKVIQVTTSSGTDQEIKSITPRTSRSQSIINEGNEESDNLNTDLEAFDWNAKRKANMTADVVSRMQKNLLMREHALAQRRKTVEELLKWHQRLLHEEKSIEHLESRVDKIIKKNPIQGNEEASYKDRVSGEETSASSMSQVALEPAVADQEVIHSRVASSTNYTADFEVESTSHKSDDQSSVSSLTHLIEDLSKIKDNILNSSLIQTHSSGLHEPTERHSQISHENAAVGHSPKESLFNSEAEEESIQEDVELTSSESDQILISLASVKERTPLSKPAIDLQASAQSTNDDPITVSEEQASVLETSKDHIEEEVEPEPAALEVEAVEASIILPEIPSTSSPLLLEEGIAIPTIPGAESASPLEPQEEISTSGEDISTSKQCEEIEDLDCNQPSTSHQENFALPLDSNGKLSEDSEESHSSASSIVSDLPSELPTQEDRQLFENKTDEEKAASLSGKSSGSSKAKVKTASPEEASTSTREEQQLSTDDAESGNSLGIKGRFSIASDAIAKLVEKPLESATSSVETATEKDTDSPQRSKTDEASTSAENLSLVVSEALSEQSQSPDSSAADKKPLSLGTEAEELHKKQLAIEQEIKLLKEQQQKEVASPFYIREIPNKPPPPYTPPSKAKVPRPPSVMPGNKDEVEQITEYSAKIIHKAYLSNNLDNITISDNTLNLIAKNIDKGCYKYVFDLCKEIAIDHYGIFLAETGPSWLHPEKKPFLSSTRPLDVNGLKELMNKKLLEMFGFQTKQGRRENAIMKWSRKKRDYVDEALVQNMHSEESTWTNFDKNEALVKDQLTNELLQMLMGETAELMQKVFQKKMDAEMQG